MSCPKMNDYSLPKEKYRPPNSSLSGFFAQALALARCAARLTGLQYFQETRSLTGCDDLVTICRSCQSF